VKRTLSGIRTLSNVCGLLLERGLFIVEECFLEGCLVGSETGIGAESLSNFSVAIWTTTKLSLELTAMPGCVSCDAETARPSAHMAVAYRTSDLLAHSRVSTSLMSLREAIWTQLFGSWY